MNANSFNIISKQTGIPVEQIFQVCSIIAGLQKQSEEGETVQTSALQNTDIPEKKYIVSKSAFETWLKGTGELVLYNDELDMYV